VPSFAERSFLQSATPLFHFKDPVFGTNLFSYAGNSPANATDPSGRIAEVVAPVDYTTLLVGADVGAGAELNQYLNTAELIFGTTASLQPKPPLEHNAGSAQRVNFIAPPILHGTGPCKDESADFVRAHRDEAAIVAQELNVPTSYVLGVSLIESRRGGSNAAIQHNNYFGLHGGRNEPLAWKAGNDGWMKGFTSYAASAQCFADSYGGYAHFASSPTAFGQALIRSRFNSANILNGGNADFIKATVKGIDTAEARMNCL